MIVLICCCSWICVSRYHSPMVLFCFVDIYPRPSSIVHFQVFVILVLSFTFLSFHDQSIWCSITNLFTDNYSLVVHFQFLLFGIIIHLFFSYSWSLWCSITNFYLKPFTFVLLVHFGDLLLTFHCCYVPPVYCSLIFFFHVVTNFFFNIVITLVDFFHFVVQGVLSFVNSWFIQVLLWDLGDIIFHCGI